jgi:RecB family exonuclease
MSAFERHGIDHLSASHINLFIAQPAMWAASYLLKKRTPVGPAAHRGTAIECGVEAALFDPEMPITAAQDLALAKFQTLTRLSADPRIEKERDNIAPSVAVALTELRQYGVPEKPEDGRQHKISIDLPGVPVPIIGYLDLLFPQHGILVDLKTTSRIPSEMSEAHARQGAIYHAAKGNHQVRFAYVSAKKIAVYALENAEAHLASVVRAAKAIENLLTLSDDGELLTRCFAPDLSSFYWGDASARSLAAQIWGSSPNSAPHAQPADY